MSLTIDLQLFPCVYYFKKLGEEKHITFELYENFQKTSFRNRFMIATANGLTSLTIPIHGGRESKRLIGETEIDFRGNWQTKHWRSIESAYKKAPFFEYYQGEVKNLLFSTEPKLFYYNYEIVKVFCKVLRINVEIAFTTQYKQEVDGVDLRNAISPKSYLSLAGNSLPVYSQVFEDRLGFRPNLSILDLLFCAGPNAIASLKK